MAVDKCTLVPNIEEVNRKVVLQVVLLVGLLGVGDQVAYPEAFLEEEGISLLSNYLEVGNAIA